MQRIGLLILRHDLHAALPGLKDFPRDKWPPVPVVFWSFRIMVGLGLAILALGLWSLVARACRRLYDWPWLHRAAVLMGPAGFCAVIAGWVTTEVGRQPYTVYGQLLTVDSHSPLASPAGATSLVVFLVVYLTFFCPVPRHPLSIILPPPPPAPNPPPSLP